MGNQFEFTVITASENEAEKLFEVAITEIQRIEKLLTTFSNDSITAKINEMAGIQAVEVDEEVFQLIKRAQFISKITQGAFDISYGSLDKKFWNFDLQMTSLPNPNEAKKSVALINYENIILRLYRTLCVEKPCKPCAKYARTAFVSELEYENAIL